MPPLACCCTICCAVCPNAYPYLSILLKSPLSSLFPYFFPCMEISQNRKCKFSSVVKKSSKKKRGEWIRKLFASHVAYSGVDRSRPTSHLFTAPSSQSLEIKQEILSFLEMNCTKEELGKELRAQSYTCLLSPIVFNVSTPKNCE